MKGLLKRLLALFMIGFIAATSSPGLTVDSHPPSAHRFRKAVYIDGYMLYVQAPGGKEVFNVWLLQSNPDPGPANGQLMIVQKQSAPVKLPDYIAFEEVWPDGRRIDCAEYTCEQRLLLSKDGRQLFERFKRGDRAVNLSGVPLPLREILAGQYANLLVDANGNLWRWAHDWKDAPSPEKLEAPKGVVQISGNVSGQMIFLTDDGQVFLWSDNMTPLLVTKTMPERPMPTRRKTEIVDIFIGGFGDTQINGEVVKGYKQDLENENIPNLKVTYHTWDDGAGAVQDIANAPEGALNG